MKPTEARAQVREALPGAISGILTLTPYRQGIRDDIPLAIQRQVLCAACARARAELYAQRADLYRDPISTVLAQLLYIRREARQFLRLLEVTGIDAAVIARHRRRYEDWTREARRARDAASISELVQLGAEGGER